MTAHEYPAPERGASPSANLVTDRTRLDAARHV